MTALAVEREPVSEITECCVDDGSHRAMVVEIAPLDDALRTCGASRVGVTRDLSEQGVGLLTEVPARTRYLRITLPGKSPRMLLLEVLRCEPLGCLFEIGGRVVDGDWNPDPRPAASFVPLQPDALL